MSATIERSLYVGILKSRYDIFDDVTITLKSGEKIKGTIEDIDDNYVYIGTENDQLQINVNDIEDCN
jgi:ribosome maturation factor RimP